MVNSEFNFYFVYFKASIYVFLLIPSSSDLETGRGLGGEKCICLMIFLFFFNWKLKSEYFADAFTCSFGYSQLDEFSI